MAVVAAFYSISFRVALVIKLIIHTGALAKLANLRINLSQYRPTVITNTYS